MSEPDALIIVSFPRRRNKCVVRKDPKGRAGSWQWRWDARGNQWGDAPSVPLPLFCLMPVLWSSIFFEPQTLLTLGMVMYSLNMPLMCSESPLCHHISSEIQLSQDRLWLYIIRSNGRMEQESQKRDSESFIRRKSIVSEVRRRRL